MTQTKIEPDKVIVNFLRSQLTDINPSRVGQWIFPDFPRVRDLGNSSFPRVSVTMLSETSDSMGIYDDTQWEDIYVQIDVVTKEDLLFSLTTTDESLGTMAASINSNRLTYTYVPNSVTNIKHDGSAYSTVTVKATDSLFTAPAALGAGTVEYSYSTGNLNFSSADVTSHDGEAITSTYVTVLEGKKACQHIAREIVKAFRNNWRTSLAPSLYYPEKVQNVPVPLDEDIGIFRQTLEYRFKGINAGEGC